MNLTGLGVAMITPFTSSGLVDYKAIPPLVDHMVNGGAAYLVVMGTTAEPPTLEKAEKEKIIKMVLQANKKRVPVVLGIGGNNTHAVIRDIQAMQHLSYQAILSVTPYYNKPSQLGMYAHYSAISAASTKPIIVYNVPARTAFNLGLDTMVKIANDCPNVIGIKEASGDFFKIQNLIKHCPKRVQIISGDDALTAPLVLAGGVGAISVLGNALPDKMAHLIQLCLNGQVKEAYTLQYKLLNLMDLIFKEGNPTGIKSLMQHLGFCNDDVRLPLVSASSRLSERLHIALQDFNKMEFSNAS